MAEWIIENYEGNKYFRKYTCPYCTTAMVVPYQFIKYRDCPWCGQRVDSYQQEENE